MLDPAREQLGYSRGSPQSKEGRLMARVTGRKTYFEDDGPWVVRGASLVKRLQKGVKRWNEFRLRNKRYRPILSSVRMPRGGDLAGYNFSNGKFVGSEFDTVSFESANLRNIDAKRTVFEHCNFKQADLTRANFFNAQCTYCDFSSARLHDAFLVRTLFRHCKMDGADFRSAEFGETDFINISLSRAEALERPSTKHHRTSI
jgi:hypothetical protein